MKINRLAVLVLFPWMLTAQPSPPSGIPSGASLPAACSLGQTFMLTTASAGSNLYACTATNTWTAQAGGGGGGAVSSVFTRTGAVTATTGDYTAAQVTNAVDSTSTYSNPGWITALANAKITGLTAFATLATGASSTYVRGDATTQTLNFAALGASAACSQLPASTGDATTSAGSCAYTVGKLNGTSLAGLATGLMKITTTTGVPSTATAGTDYVGGQANLSISGCVAYQTSNGILTCVSGLTWDGTNLNSPGGLTSGGAGTGVLTMTAGSAPSSPASGNLALYYDSGNSNHISVKNSGGTVVDLQAGGGSGSMTQISNQLLGGAAASVSFTSIPGTYHQLVFYIVARCSGATADDHLSIQANADTGANYGYQYNVAVATTVSAGSQGASGVATPLTGDLSCASTWANGASTFEVTIPQYSDTTFTKQASIISQSVIGTGFGTAAFVVGNWYWLWNNTAAITQITFKVAGGSNFITGSHFTLYGIN